MHHKRKPILMEKLTGIVSYIRSAVIPSMENIALWHERDISHSSVERIFSPDITIATDFALARLTDVIKNLIVYPNNMLKNIHQFGGLHKSQNILLALTQKGLSRQKAYTIVQSSAMKSWNSKEKFEDIIRLNDEIKKHLTEEELNKVFSKDNEITNIEWIYNNKLKI